MRGGESIGGSRWENGQRKMVDGEEGEKGEKGRALIPVNAVIILIRSSSGFCLGANLE